MFIWCWFPRDYSYCQDKGSPIIYDGGGDLALSVSKILGAPLPEAKKFRRPPPVGGQKFNPPRTPSRRQQNPPVFRGKCLKTPLDKEKKCFHTILEKTCCEKILPPNRVHKKYQAPLRGVKNTCPPPWPEVKKTCPPPKNLHELLGLPLQSGFCTIEKSVHFRNVNRKTCWQELETKLCGVHWA